MILAKNAVIARAASARRVVFAALLRPEETLDVVRLGVSPGSCSRSLLCGADMTNDGNDKRYRSAEERENLLV